MDCCSKYSQYRHHPLGGGIIANADNSNGINSPYYSHIHPSLRYQPSLYRLSNPGFGYNGIGPPTSIPLSPPPNLYQNYDRFGSYSNLSSYAYNSNSFSCGNVNFREMNEYYNHCDSFSRMGIGSTNLPYHSYRDYYDMSVHNPRSNNYNMYTHPLSEREYHQNSSNGYHSLSTSYYHHHHLHHGHSQLRGTFREPFMSRIPDTHKFVNNSNNNERDVCNGSNSSNTSHSDIASVFLPETNVNGNSCTNTSSRTDQLNGNYNSFSNCETTNSSRKEKLQQQNQQISSDGVGDISTEFSSHASKESKIRKSTTREKDKSFSKQMGTNRKVECSTPSDQSPLLERAGTPFNSNAYLHSSLNTKNSRVQNGYHSSSQSNNYWPPYPNSPNNWNQQFSPKSFRKRCQSPKLSPSSITSLSFSKSRVLECDFIPSKKSKRKIKSESSGDCSEYREEIKDITPLPGFQQAFGSTEIGRFSETFFSAVDSPLEPPYESEADTLSPQPWETGDSLDGPHYNLHIGASVQPMYFENHNAIDSPIYSNYFNEIRCSDY